MLNVALTGNIGAGKSTVVDLFRKWGAPSSRRRPRPRAQAPGSAVLAAIAGRSEPLLGQAAHSTGRMRAKVMGDDAALAALNAIVHPAVQQRRPRAATDGRERVMPSSSTTIPLLFESSIRRSSMR